VVVPACHASTEKANQEDHEFEASQAHIARLREGRKREREEERRGREGGREKGGEREKRERRKERENTDMKTFFSLCCKLFLMYKLKPSSSSGFLKLTKGLGLST
jgi:hypothetical protein